MHNVFTVGPNCMKIDFVSHSMYAYADSDYAIQAVLETGIIEPRAGKWKIGLSVNGCYRAFDKKYVYGCASFIFDFEVIKDKVKPTLYLPITNYRWYEFDNYMVTWHNLAWETELCLLKGQRLYLEEVRALALKTRRKKLIQQIEKAGLTRLENLPYSPLQKWAKEHLAAFKNEKLRVRMADKYNAWVSKYFDLDYQKIKQKFPELIQQKEIERLGPHCRICKHYYFDFDLVSKNTVRECLLTNRKTDLDDTCNSFSFQIEPFLNLKFFSLIQNNNPEVIKW